MATQQQGLMSISVAHITTIEHGSVSGRDIPTGPCECSAMGVTGPAPHQMCCSEDLALSLTCCSTLGRAQVVQWPWWQGYR